MGMPALRKSSAMRFVDALAREVGVFEAIDSFPADEAARVAKLRREFACLLARLSGSPRA